MKNRDKLVKQAFQTLKGNGLPTESQKNTILDCVMAESDNSKSSFSFKLKQKISVYPWRFAFAVSAVWTMVFTFVFGTQYTNIFLRLFGG